MRPTALRSGFAITSLVGNNYAKDIKDNFSYGKSCPSSLLCVGNPESKGISRRPSLSSLVDGQ